MRRTLLIDLNEFKEAEKYWMTKFSGEINETRLLNDSQVPHPKSYKKECLKTWLGNGSRLTEKLLEMSKNNHLSLYIILLSAFKILISRYTGQRDIIVTSPIYTLTNEKYNRYVALRDLIDPGLTFKEQVLRVKETVVEGYRNEYYPIDYIRDWLEIGASASLSRLVVILESIHKKELITHHIHHLDNDLTLCVRLANSPGNREQLEGEILYNSHLFKKSTMRHLADTYSYILKQVVNDIDIKIGEIEFMGKEEKKKILVRFNDTAVNSKVFNPGQVLHRLFESQVEKTPGNLAVQSSRDTVNIYDEYKPQRIDLQVTYEELYDRSHQLAKQLWYKGIGPGRIIALMVDHPLEMAVGIWGILKAGAAYLPIIPHHPIKAINRILRDSNARVLVTEKSLPGIPGEITSSLSLSVIYMEEVRELDEEVAAPEPALLNNQANLAYVIYTSGTTGIPKGTLVEHKGVVNYTGWRMETLGLTGKDAALQPLSYSFDGFVSNFYSTLLSGGALHIVPGEKRMEPDYMKEVIAGYSITNVSLVPGIYDSLLDSAAPKDLRSLRLVVLAGEKSPAHLIEKSKEKAPHVKLFNEYGPTETTVTAAGGPRIHDNNSIVGRPIFNVCIYILDNHLRPQPPNVPGELCIAGVGVARGYLNNPELTAEKFIGNPFVLRHPHNTAYSSPPAVLYRTGDRARWLPDGNIEFIGRTDNQVKIRGFRIEMGEIESVLLKHKAIKNAVVQAREDEKRGKYLCAYFVTKTFPPGDAVTVSRLREYLADRLTDYMIPTYFVKLDEIPLNTHGKVDTAALPEPGAMNLEREAEFVPARNTIEKELVKIWEKVLGISNIGINENFFRIGGDSIKAIQVISRMNRIGYRLEMKDIFQHPTAAELALRAKKLERISDQDLVTGTIPLTPIQKRFFTNSRVDPHHFNQAVMLYTKEELQEETIKAIFKKIQEHHDTLRMTYNKQNGEILQVNHGTAYPLFLQTFDLSNRQDSREILEAKANEMQASLDLENGPLMKLGLFHLDDGNRLLIVIHHLIVDGVSWRILFEDIGTLYQQYKTGKQMVLPLKGDSFKIWAEKLSEYADSETFLKEKTYWKKLESVEVPQIKKDFDAGDCYIKDTERLSFKLSREETDHLLTKVNEAFSTEINDVLLTALGLAIKKTFGHNQILIMLEGHGREKLFSDVDINRTIGWYTSIHPVLLDVSYESDIGRQIKEVKESLRKVPKKGIGYGILRFLTSRENKKDINFQLNPQVTFNYLGQFDVDIGQMSFEIAKESPGNVQGIKEQIEFEIEVNGMTANNRLVMNIAYNKKQYRRETIETLMTNFQTRLERIITYCSAKEHREFTPGDFTYKGLTIETVDRLSRQYDIEDLYQLTPMQEGMLFHTLYETLFSTYFEQMSYRLHGELDISYVEKSLNELLQRHDILRTVFVHENLDQPIQIVLKDRQIDFHYENISQIRGTEEKEIFIEEFKKKDKQRFFNISEDVLIRVSVLRVDPSEYEVIWSHHHILMDGWCREILILEFFEIYNSYLERRSYQLPEKVQYRTFIKWLDKQDKEVSRNYWKKYIEDYEEEVGVPKINLYKKNEAGYRHEQMVFQLKKEKTVHLNHLTGKNNVTLNVIVQAIWGIILGKYNNKEDVVFGAVVSGRPPEIESMESMVGLFINTVPVRIKYKEKTTFKDLLQTVQKAAIESEPHHYYPLAEIQSGSDLKQGLIDHVFAFENYPGIEQIEGYEDKIGKNNHTALTISKVDVFEQTNYDFNVIITPGNLLSIKFLYNGNVYRRDFVEIIARHFNLVLTRIINNEELEIGELTLLSREEREQVLIDFNDTEAEYPGDKTIHELFEEQVEKIPHHIALVGQIPNVGGMHLTYVELNQRSNQLAHLLGEKGVQPDTIVAIMLERSCEMVVGILAILKAGGAYLPVDPGYPGERKKYMLEDSAVKIVLTNYDKEKELNHIPGKIKMIDLGDKHIYCGGNRNPQPLNRAAHLLYVIYTSGSTGKPKGVMLEHRNLVNLLIYGFEFTNLDFSSTLQYFTISFDVSFQEIFSALLSGGKLVLIDRETKTNLLELFEVIEKNKIKTVYLPMSLLKVIFNDEYYAELFPACVEHIQTAGEQVVISGKFGNYLKKNNIYLHNHYGPAETHVATSFTLDPADEIPALPPIGKPVSNTEIDILDKNGNLQPIGVTGELFIGGIPVGKGYLNRPELTAEKFCLRRPGGLAPLLYRTGDLARWLPDGNIEFLGRIDHQVKIRGFRIEPGEIENHLMSIDYITEAVVIDRRDEKGDRYLTAYIAAREVIEVSELKNILSRSLPGYMIPSYIVQVEQIPLNPNGKVDRKALPKPGIKTGDSCTAPRDEVEKKLTEIWSEILGIEKDIIGIDSNFLQLGGHSLKVTILMAKILKKFCIKITLKDIFTRPTIREMGKYIVGAAEKKYTAIKAVEEKEYYTLSSAQKRLYILQQMHKQGIGYNIPYVLILEGDVDKERLSGAFNRLIKRHDSLRTSFKMVGGEPVQEVHDEVDFNIEYYNFSKYGEERQGTDDGRTVENIIKDFMRHFDLSQAPLLRVGLIKSQPQEHILMLDMHHIITDGVSQTILVNDINRFYRGDELLPLELQYKDYSEWQRGQVVKGELKLQEEYWLKEIDGEIPILNMPTDYTRPEIFYSQGDYVNFIIDTKTCERLNLLTRETGTTLSMVLFSTYNILLSKYTGQEDIVVGSTVAGRSHGDLQNIIGMFVNMLPIRIRPREDKTFKEFVMEVKEKLLAAMENQDYQFDELVSKLGLKRNPGSNPLFNVVFNMINIDTREVREVKKNSLNIRPYKFKHEATVFDLILSVFKSNNIINMSLKYSTGLFKRTTVEKMAKRYIDILNQVLDNSEIKLKDIKLSHGLVSTVSNKQKYEENVFGF